MTQSIPTAILIHTLKISVRKWSRFRVQRHLLLLDNEANKRLDFRSGYLAISLKFVADRGGNLDTMRA